MVVEGEYYDGPCKILELPHYVMRILFSYLDATSLYHLSRTCNYLKEFILDPLFWRQIDARDDPNIYEKIDYCARRIHSRTTHLYLRGNLNFVGLPGNFFTTINPFENLKVLALENFKLSGSKITLRDFPSGLEELSLKKTYVKNSDYFFQHSVKNLPKLRVLILDECSWVTCSFLLSVSKYEHLEIISIVKCLRVHLNMIPYLNVAKLGCKKLKIFDCRFTGIGGELLRTFYSKENLQRLYFQSIKSAEVDYQEKIANHLDSRQKKQSPDTSYTDMNILDMHLSEYSRTSAKPRNEVEKIANSILYKDPYPECTCGGEGGQDGQIKNNVKFTDDDMILIPSGKGEPKFVCSKHMKDIVNLPKNFQEFFLSQQQQFHPASEYLDSDSNSDDEEEDGGCCYFGMGTSLIVPSMHDRTPSAGEEMSLPVEGASARNQALPTVYVINSNRDRSNNQDNKKIDGNTANTSKPHSERRSSQDNLPCSSSMKRRHENSDEDSDSEKGHGKKSKKAKNSQQSTSNLDGLSLEAQESLVNQLVESVDDVSARIERIMEANGIAADNLQRRSNRYSIEDSMENGSRHFPNNIIVKSPRNSSVEKNPADMPSCSRNDTSNGQPSTSNNNRINIEGNSIERVEVSNTNNNNNSNNNVLRPIIQERRIENQYYYFIREHNFFKSIPLRRISLRGYKNITDFALNHLNNLDIELIDLTYTNVTRSGIENFLVHNPNCRVIHPLYCICKPKNPFF